MISVQQVAHDLTLVYLRNRFGAEVSGEFEVDGSDGSVHGTGSVSTSRLPGFDEIAMKRVPTGEKWLGLFGKTTEIPDGHAIDPVLEKLVDEYAAVYGKVLRLLRERAGEEA